MKRFLLIGSVLCAGCTGPADAVDQSGATDGPVVEATVRPALPSDEICGDGRDNDHDGLVDCEDAACVVTCEETCDNGVDDDGDGLTDQFDAMCWTPSTTAAQITSQVGGGGTLTLAAEYEGEFIWGSPYVYWESVFTMDVALDSAWGTAQVTTAAASVPVTCNWGATGIQFGRVRRWERSSFRQTTSDIISPVTRASSWVDSGCPVSAAMVLPSYLSSSGRGHFGALRSGGLIGRRWYVAALPYFDMDFDSRSYQSWRGKWDWYWHQYTVSGALGAGDPVALAP